MDGGWYTIATPAVDNMRADDMAQGNYDLFAYDEPTNYWINQKQEDGGFAKLNLGQGYLYANSATRTLNFEGQAKASNAAFSVPVSYTAFALSALGGAPKHGPPLQRRGGDDPDPFTLSPPHHGPSPAAPALGCFWAGREAGEGSGAPKVPRMDRGVGRRGLASPGPPHRPLDLALRAPPPNASPIPGQQAPCLP